MEIWQAIVLGAVQGFTEFLPVSSSGHLILLQNWFGISQNVVFYSIMLHIGTLIPVVIVLWKQIVGLFKKPFSKFGYLVLATIPAAIVGVVFSVAFDLDLLFTKYYWLLAITFLLTATELIFAERRSKKLEMNNGINVKTAFIMGGGQALGVIPGLSRSGTTITAGCIGKVNREDNANFTFLMSIPIIIAAAAMELIGGIKDGTLVSVSVAPLLIGMVTAAVCGYIAIKFMLKIIKKANYKWFSLYLVGIAIATVVTYFV